jgi:hypothetical protein
MKVILPAGAAALLLSCASHKPVEPTYPAEIARIVAKAEEYDGKLVRVRGAAVVRFEASFICPDAQTIASGNSAQECLWLAPGEPDGRAHDIRRLHGKTVEIVGRFDSKHFGHAGAFGGTIAVTGSTITGRHDDGEIPPPPPSPPPG